MCLATPPKMYVISPNRRSNVTFQRSAKISNGCRQPFEVLRKSLQDFRRRERISNGNESFGNTFKEIRCLNGQIDWTYTQLSILESATLTTYRRLFNFKILKVKAFKINIWLIRGVLKWKKQRSLARVINKIVN